MSLSSQTVPATGNDAAPVERSRPVLASICVCTVLVVGFVASINLAVPQLAASDLHPSSTQLLWIVDAYVVLFACLVIPAGALGDRMGRKGVLLAGLVVFAVGAGVSALAPGVAVMLAGRAVTGVGAACILPNALGVLVHATEPVRRRHAIAIWAAMSGAGGVLGNLGGGLVLTAGSWRWLFAAVVPVALGCALWVAAAAPRGARHRRAVDLPGAVLLTLATLALLIGIIQGPEQGWRSVIVVGAFAASAALLLAWIVAELRLVEPLLDPRLFRSPALSAACLGMLVVFFGMFGFFYLNASLLQYGRGFTVLQAGLGVVPMTLPMLLGAGSVPRLTARVGERLVLATAFLVIGIALVGLSVALDEPYPVYAGWLVVVGVGITLALPTLTATIAASIPHEQAGVAGGLQSTTRELGSALGVAVIGTLLTTQFGHHLSSHTGGRTLDRSPHTVAEALAAHPADHRAVIGAYTAGAATALLIVALVVLASGALVIAGITWTSRRAAGRPPIRATLPGDAVG